ncbi:MAG TPA: hypothetical protein VEJ63_17995 [Planctomycetota bacterium]|nr:hypothetical protein [Planctomycetota bacterium]
MALTLAWASNLTSMATIAQKHEPSDAQRWLKMLPAVIALHVVPLVVMTMPLPAPPEERMTMAVDFDDAALAALVKEVEAAPVQQQAPAELKKEMPTSAPAPLAVPAPKPEALKASPPIEKAVEAKPRPPEPEKKPAVLDLDPFNPTMAFDESKTTKEEPKGEAYLSDRTSTAADRGPKNLPRGDPYIDKGQSTEIRALQKRGEGNLPAIASDANSGSVKKEGSPDAGKGPQDKERLPDREAPLAPPALKAPKEEKGLAPLTEASKAAGARDTPASAPMPKALDAEKTDVIAEKIEKGLAESEQRELKAKPETPKIADQGPQVGKPEPVKDFSAATDGEKAKAEQKAVGEEPAATAPKKKEPSELEAFKALLDGKGKSDGRGGDAGDKTGIHAREGSKGHEGDGTLRPGHDEAVSDVTTVNLESSAAEFDEARFAKRADEKSKYFKAAFRRIDGKWKAEIAARSRFRFERGVVSMRIVISREGKLLDASEVLRTPKGLADEYVTIAKEAIKRACDPTGDPFPAALQKFEKLECVVNFLY